MPLDKTLWKVEFICAAPEAGSTITVTKLKRDSLHMTNCCQFAHQCLCWRVHSISRHRCFCGKGNLYSASFEYSLSAVNNKQNSSCMILSWCFDIYKEEFIILYPMKSIRGIFTACSVLLHYLKHILKSFIIIHWLVANCIWNFIF